MSSTPSSSSFRITLGITGMGGKAYSRPVGHWLRRAAKRSLGPRYLVKYRGTRWLTGDVKRSTNGVPNLAVISRNRFSEMVNSP